VNLQDARCNNRDHSSMLRRKPVAVTTRVALLQYRGLRRRPSLSRWYFYKL